MPSDQRNGAEAAARLDERFTIPSTVSREAAGRLKLAYDFIAALPPQVKPSSLEEWDLRRAQSETFAIGLGQATVDALQPWHEESLIGGVPVVRVRPARWQSNGRVLVFLHGGGYVTGSARAALAPVAIMAAATSTEIVAINYTKAPRGRWQAVTDEVLAVWAGLLDAGVHPHAAGFFGESAGGGLAAGAVLKMRDRNMALPAALSLAAPWADITATGDTISTLAAAEPFLTSESLAWGADLYADPSDQQHPYVSPVYGDFSQHFPPTLIQVGTRDFFLSHAVRLYQAIRSGGHAAILDVYEGMPHGFQALLADVPEGRTAVARTAEFFDAHLSVTGPEGQAAT